MVWQTFNEMKRLSLFVQGHESGNPMADKKCAEIYSRGTKQDSKV